MFCPKCGSNQGEGRKFCTLCGTNLSAVSQALTGRIAQSHSFERAKRSDSGLRLIIIGAGFLAWQFSNFLFSRHFSGSLFGVWGLVGCILLAIGISRTISSKSGGDAAASQRTSTPQSANPVYVPPPHAPQMFAQQQADPHPIFSAPAESSAQVPHTNELEPLDHLATASVTPTRVTPMSVTEDETLHLPANESPTRIARK